MSALPAAVAELVDAVEALEPCADGDAIVAMREAHDQLAAVIAASTASYVAAEGPRREGWPSTKGWLQATVPTTDARARTDAKVATRLRAWPAIAQAWVDGVLTGAQVELTCRLVPKAHVELFAVDETDHVAELAGETVARTRSALLNWVAQADALCAPDPATLPGEGDPESGSALFQSRLLDDRSRVDGDLDADLTVLFEAALALVERADRPGELRSAAQRRADALREMCELTLGHWNARRHKGARRHPDWMLTLDLVDLAKLTLDSIRVRTPEQLDAWLAAHPATLTEEALLRHGLTHGTGQARTLTGHRLSADLTARLFRPGSLVHRVLLADGELLDLGTGVRLVEGPLRHAMLVRDGGCRFPTTTGERCDAPVAWIAGHHVTPHEHGGPTALTNSMSNCDSHHGVVHRHDWHDTLDPDGTYRVTRPDGTTLIDPPPRRLRPPELALSGRDRHADPPTDPPTDDLPAGPPVAATSDDDLRAAVLAAVDATHDPDDRADEGRDLGLGDEPTWTVTRRDRDGRPLEGTRGHEHFTIDWDLLAPTTRAPLRELTLRRLHRLAA